MSKIPYIFETPIPKYFREHGWFDNENTYKFVIWAFSRCQSLPHKEIWDGKEILLEPFEFICGRNKSSESCFLTAKEFRGQLISMQDAGLLKKGANSRANRFTSYIWLTDRFCKNHGQLSGQERANLGPTEGHKQRTEEHIAIKEQQQEQAPLSVVCSFSCLNGLGLSDADIQKLCKFPEIEVIRAVQVMREYKKPIDSSMGFLLKAIERKYQPKSNPKISLTEKAEKNKFDIFRYAAWDEKLKSKDIAIVDMIDHVLFGHIQIFYESENFSKEVGAARKHFNLLNNHQKYEEKIILFKSAEDIAQKFIKEEK